MQNSVSVATYVSRNMFKKVRLGINPEQLAGKLLVIISTARADTVLSYQIRDVSFPR